MKTKLVKAQLTGYKDGLLVHPTWELPADADSYERMVEQVMHGMRNASTPILTFQMLSRAALRAIGITAPRQKKGTQ